MTFLEELGRNAFIGRRENAAAATQWVLDNELEVDGKPQEGMWYFDTTEHFPKWWDGDKEAWVRPEGTLTVLEEGDTPIGDIRKLRFIAGSNVGIIITDEGDGEASILISSTGGGGGGGGIQSGYASLGAGIGEIEIILPASYTDTNYAVAPQIINEVDANPPIIMLIVVDRQLDRFRVRFSANTPSVNYVITWITNGVLA